MKHTYIFTRFCGSDTVHNTYDRGIIEEIWREEHLYENRMSLHKEFHPIVIHHPSASLSSAFRIINPSWSIDELSDSAKKT